MANRGIMTISNQTFLAIKPEDQAPITNWVTTPWMPAMHTHELQYLAVVVAEMWEKTLAGKPLLEDYEEDGAVAGPTDNSVFRSSHSSSASADHEDKSVSIVCAQASPVECKVK